MLRTRLLIVAALAAVLSTLPLQPSAPAQAARAHAVPPIEGFPGYHPQSTCHPRAKVGTVRLARYLLRRYPGTGSLGISQSCSVAGVSEHKEGRAFDWRLDVRSARDRRYAESFMHRLFRSDRAGHPDALARRMGIMYLIWDDHIYSAGYHYARRPYLSAGCRTRRHCSTTLRHRDHMHISLTRRAAHGRTSWYRAHGL